MNVWDVLLCGRTRLFEILIVFILCTHLFRVFCLEFLLCAPTPSVNEGLKAMKNGGLKALKNESKGRFYS